MIHRAVYAVLLCLFCLGTTAQANPITYLSDDRFVLARATACDWNGQNCITEEDSAEPDPPFSAFDVSFSRTVEHPDGDSASVAARQTSVLGPYSMTDEGYISLDDTWVGLSAAESVFSVRFSLEESRPFSLSGSVWGYDGRAIVRLEKGDGTVLYDVQHNDIVPLDFDYSGTLAAGVYVMRAWGYEELPLASAGWNFLFTVVPEPGTGMLVLLGLLGLGKWKRQQRQAAASRT